MATHSSILTWRIPWTQEPGGVQSIASHREPGGLQPTRLLCPWDSPGKNTGVGCHTHPGDPQGDLPDPGIKPASPEASALQAD